MITEKERQDNENRMIESAKRCFVKYGIEESTQTVIAEGAGVSVRSVKRYFPKRILLVDAVAKHIFGDLEKQIDDKMAIYFQSDCSGREELKLFLKSFVETLLSNNQEIVFMQSVDYYYWSNGADKSEFWSKNRVMSYIHREIKRLLIKGIADKSIAEINNKEIACEIICHAVLGYIEHIDSEVRAGVLSMEKGIDKFMQAMDQIEKHMYIKEKEQIPVYF